MEYTSAPLMFAISCSAGAMQGIADVEALAYLHSCHDHLPWWDTEAAPG